ncbi:hypothetical protein BOX15_Mlig033224g3 [Macrostomum lignano]|uniref:Transcription initiation factor TFIID subunit 8 n=2 Tax=Macrostomum lignano TaxID=282301 RepID=A0A267FW10_9PLAT|nr:hypothetical protein BOX15_Mlig033224g3 [Macrostomum lignano]
MSANNDATAYEQCLRRSLAAILIDCGFQSSTRRCLRLLQAALEHFLSQVGQSARAYAEACGRTQPVLGDATMALVDYGVTVSSLIDFARQPRPAGTGGQQQRQQRNIPAVFGHDWLAEAALKRQSTAATSDRRAQQQTDRPNHIPDHLPPYPRPHTFVSTPAFRLRRCHQQQRALDDISTNHHNTTNNSSNSDPLDDLLDQQYDDVDVYRRRGAEHRRQTELSLTRFLAATGQTHSLFPDELTAVATAASNPFRLTANELSARPYVAALTGGDVQRHQSSESASPSSLSPGKPRPNHPNPYLRPAKFPL